MARTDRLFRLLTSLRTLPPPVTAARLAEATEVSERTLYRDIESLRAAGALIDGAPGVGYTLTEDPALPPQTFDRMEIEALVVGLSDASQRGDPELAEAARSALAKIAATLPARLQRDLLHATHRVHRYRAAISVGPDLSIIRTACWEERALDIGYRDRDGRMTERRIHPLALVYVDQGVGVLAWCCLRSGFRTFIVGRMTRVDAADESFRPHRARLLREFLAKREGC